MRFSTGQWIRKLILQALIFISVVPVFHHAYARDSITIRGRVSDLADHPAPGVRLMSVAKNDSVFTDENGVFEIVVDETIAIDNDPIIDNLAIHLNMIPRLAYLGADTLEAIIHKKAVVPVSVRDDEELIVENMAGYVDGDSNGVTVTYAGGDRLNVAFTPDKAGPFSLRIEYTDRSGATGELSLDGETLDLYRKQFVEPVFNAPIKNLGIYSASGKLLGRTADDGIVEFDGADAGGKITWDEGFLSGVFNLARPDSVIYTMHDDYVLNALMVITNQYNERIPDTKNWFTYIIPWFTDKVPYTIVHADSERVNIPWNSGDLPWVKSWIARCNEWLHDGTWADGEMAMHVRDVIIDTSATLDESSALFRSLFTNNPEFKGYAGKKSKIIIENDHNLIYLSL